MGSRTSQSKSQWGELYGSFGQWCTDQHHHARVCQNHSLDIGPLSDLMCRWVVCSGLGNTLTQPIGYIIIWFQVDGVKGYNEDQIALIVPDWSNFMVWIPVILGTPMIGHIMNVIKERERDIETLAMPWVNAHIASLLVVQWVTTTLESNKVTTRVLDSTKYDKVVTTKGCKMIYTFSSKIIHAQMKTAFTSLRLNVMTHALCAGKGLLPLGLMIQNAYTEMHNGRKYVAIVGRNSTVYPQTLKKIPVARVLSANQMPEPQAWPGMIDVLDEAQGIQTPMLTTEQRQKRCSRC